MSITFMMREKTNKMKTEDEIIKMKEEMIKEFLDSEQSENAPSLWAIRRAMKVLDWVLGKRSHPLDVM